MHDHAASARDRADYEARENYRRLTELEKALEELWVALPALQVKELSDETIKLCQANHAKLWHGKEPRS